MRSRDASLGPLNCLAVNSGRGGKPAGWDRPNDRELDGRPRIVHRPVFGHDIAQIVDEPLLNLVKLSRRALIAPPC